MRNNGTDPKGNVVGNNISPPISNGVSHHKEEVAVEAQRVAAKVVKEVVQLAAETACRKGIKNCCDLPLPPTIQIDTVPSPPWSPVDSEPEELPPPPPPLEEEDVQLHIEEESNDSLSEEFRDTLRSFIEDLIEQAMGVAEKKLQFADLEDDDVEVEAPEADESTTQKSEGDAEEKEARVAAEKVVEEVIARATERVEAITSLEFPDLPSIQIDTVISRPPSPEEEEEQPLKPKKWSFKVTEEKDHCSRITFQQAPEDVKNVAESFVKDIVGRAVAAAEEKSVPMVPFNFEDVEFIKTSGPWYIRMRDGLMRVLRTACFCTPQRDDT